MFEGPIKSLEGRKQLLFANALLALAEGKFNYAILACAEILRDAPRFVPARQLQRDASLGRLASGGCLEGNRASPRSASPFIFGVNEDDPRGSFVSAEKILAVDPTSAIGLKLLGQSAELLHWTETAVFAYEVLREIRPDDRETLLALAGALLADGRGAEGVGLAQQVLKKAPEDPVARRLLGDVVIRHPLSAGTQPAIQLPPKWGAATS